VVNTNSLLENTVTTVTVENTRGIATSLSASIIEKFRPPLDDNTPASCDEKVAKETKVQGTGAKHIDGCRNVGMKKKQPLQRVQGGVLHIRSNTLDTELLIVPDSFLDDDLSSKVYKDSEVKELARQNVTSEGLRAIHLVRTVFGGMIEDGRTPPEVLHDTPTRI
jgi:hypothetical protein